MCNFAQSNIAFCSVARNYNIVHAFFPLHASRFTFCVLPACTLSNSYFSYTIPLLFLLPTFSPSFKINKEVPFPHSTPKDPASFLPLPIPPSLFFFLQAFVPRSSSVPSQPSHPIHAYDNLLWHITIHSHHSFFIFVPLPYHTPVDVARLEFFIFLLDPFHPSFSRFLSPPLPSSKHHHCSSYPFWYPHHTPLLTTGTYRFSLPRWVSQPRFCHGVTLRVHTQPSFFFFVRQTALRPTRDPCVCVRVRVRVQVYVHVD